MKYIAYTINEYLIEIIQTEIKFSSTELYIFTKNANWHTKITFSLNR